LSATSRHIRGMASSVNSTKQRKFIADLRAVQACAESLRSSTFVHAFDART
jgi:hypothetical protein